MAHLASNPERPSRAADSQEKVQMMGWKVTQQIADWRIYHPGQLVPTPGTKQFRTEILSPVIMDHELKEGTGMFLFTNNENLALIQNLWSISYFQVNNAIPLTLLEAGLGKAGKKDLSKKSGSAMVNVFATYLPDNVC